MAKTPCNELSCIQVPNIIRMEGKLDTAINKIDDIKTEINYIRENYVPKQEYSHSEKRIENLESVLSKVTWIVISTVIIAVLALILK